MLEIEFRVEREIEHSKIEIVLIRLGDGCH
jgi:hypothetical protein